MHSIPVQRLYGRLEKAIPFFFFVCCLLIGSLWSCRPSSQPGASSSSASGDSQGETAAEAVSSIRSPFENLKMPGEVLRVEDPGKPSVLRLRSGTELSIPANCFVNEAGDVVTAPVEIRFQEFHEAAEIIAAGIPMHTVGPGGRKEWLQTAGMFDIRGSSGGRPVEVARGRAIEVDFVSKVDGAYDVWIFNEAQGAWENQGPGNAPQPVASEGAPVNPQLLQEVADLMRRTATAPAKPVPTPEPEKLVFTDLDTRRCPDLQGVHPVVLTYAGDDPAKNPRNNRWIANPGIWYKKELKPAKEPGVYQLTLFGDSLFSIPVRQAIDGDKLEDAMAEYKKAMAEYQANLELLKQKRQAMARQDAFRREMIIRNFGLYNYDILWKMPDLIPLMADFDFGNMPPALKELVTVYQVTGGGRTVISLSQGDWKNFRYSPGSDNKLLAVLPDNSVALFSQSDFNAAKVDIERAKGREYVFVMRLKPQEVNSLESLRSLLNEAAM